MSKLKIFENIDQAINIVPERAIKKLKINGKSVCMANINNEFFAFETKCPHMDHALEEGSLNPFGEITCPWHGYRFSLIDGKESENRCRKLQLYPITVNDKKEVFILF